MTRLQRSRLALLVGACALFAAAPCALAEKADKDKTINFSAEQPPEIDIERRSGTAKGNVVITQGTITIRADRIDFRQNADNSLYATAFGNPITFRQKKDDSDEYYEGAAQKAVYDGSKDVLELFDRALLKEGANEIRSNYIWYNNATNQLRAEGRPDAPDATDGPGARVRGTFEPRSDSAPAKGATKDDNGKSSPSAKPAGKPTAGKGPATSATTTKPPVTLKSADAPSK